MHRVFISSTSKDLHNHREAVRDAVLKLGMHPVMMEHFPAMDADAVEACKRKVLDCDLFIGIYAHRYGYTPAGYSHSITELEYDWAKTAHVPRHLFVVKPDHPWPAEFTDAPDNHAKLDAFKTRVGTGHVWSEFTTPDSLAAAVTQSLVHDAERLSRDQAKQRRLYIGGILTVALLIIAAIAAILLTKLDEEKIGISQANREATHLVESTLNAQATQTIIALTPTPLEGKPAEKGETLLLVADFKRIDADATNIEPNLEREFEATGVHYLRIHHPITNREQAREVLRTYNAALILWGDVARGGVAVQFEAAQSNVVSSPLGFGQITVSAADVPSFDAYVFAGMDTRYVVEFALGRIHWSDDDPQSALASYARAESLIPAGREKDVHAESLHLLQGMAYIDLGDIDSAIAEYEAASAIVPDWAFPHILMAQAYLNSNRLAETQAAVDHAFTLSFARPGIDAATTVYFESVGRFIRVTLATFNIYLAPEKVDSAAVIADLDWVIANSDMLLAAFPQFPLDGLYLIRGGVYSANGDYAAAQANYDKAIEINPTDPSIYYSRALMLTIQGEYTAALADVTAAIELNNADTSFFALRGDILNYMGDYPAALADYNRAIELQPDEAKLFSGRGNIYHALEDYAAALADFDHALELDPTNPAYRIYRANTYRKMDDYSTAISEYTAVLKADPLPLILEVDELLAEIYANRGYCYLQQGQFASAIADFTQSLDINPIADTYLLRANAAMFAADVEAAAADFDAVLALDPTELRVFMGRIYLYSNVPGHEDCEQALANLAQYQSLGGDDPDIANWAQQVCLLATPSPTPQSVTDAVFADGTVVTLPSPRPTTLISEPLVGMPIAFCTPGTEATVLQTAQIANGSRWIEMQCDGGTGWLAEDDLPQP